MKASEHNLFLEVDNSEHGDEGSFGVVVVGIHICHCLEFVSDPIDFGSKLFGREGGHDDN